MKSIEKKGQVQISFNWIFVLIAGAVILFFFITVITKEQASSEQQITDKVSARLETIFSVLQENPDSIAENDELTFELDFYCDEEGHYYKLKDSSSKAYLNTETIFAPQTIGASKLISWSSTYSTPYPATPVLFLSDEKTLYIFVDNNEKIVRLYDDFPDLFEKRLVEPNEIVDPEGFRNFVIITYSLGSLPSTQSSKFREKVLQIIVVDSTNTDVYSVGRVGFFDFILANPVQVGSDVGYFSKELLFGAIVSGDKKLYECTLDKVMQKARITGKANIKRIEALGEEYPLTHKCSPFYTTLINAEIQKIIDYSTSPYNFNNLKNSAETIERYNNEILRQSCVLIY